MDPAGLLVVLCGAAGAASLLAWVRTDSAWASRLGPVAGAACLAASVVVWGLRWRSAGHLPLFGTYEAALSLAVAVLAATALAHLLRAPSISIWPLSCGLAAALVAHGRSYDRSAFPLTISERSWVVDVHALLAWAAFGALAVNAGLALGRLAGRPALRSHCGRALGVSLSAGFLLHSAMLASGSLYKFLLFGSAWSFDPIESLALVAWLAYGTLLHLHLLGGWDERRLARWCLSLFVLLLVSYRGIVYFPAWSTYHIFDMDLRIHLTGSPQEGPGDRR